MERVESMATDDKAQIRRQQAKHKRNYQSKIDTREAQRNELELQGYDTRPEPLKKPIEVKRIVDSIQDNIISMFDNEVLSLLNELGKNELKTNQYVFCLSQINKKYISKEIFKNKEDKENEFLLYALTQVYLEIITKYDFVSSIDAYCRYIGINPDTFYKWESGESRGYKYYTPEGEPIYSISAYKTNYPGREFVQELSFSRSDLAKLVRNLGKSNIRNKLADTPLGVTVLANNDRETGLRYNAQSMLESATIQHAISANNLPKLE